MSFNVDLKGARSFRTFNGYAPKTGSRSIHIPLDFSLAADSILNIDPTNIIDFDSLEFVQSIFVNNRLNPNDLLLVFEISQQRIAIPAQSQAYLTVLAPDSAAFTATTDAMFNQACSVTLLNFPVANVIWKT